MVEVFDHLTASWQQLSSKSLSKSQFYFYCETYSTIHKVLSALRVSARYRFRFRCRFSCALRIKYEMQQIQIFHNARFGNRSMTLNLCYFLWFQSQDNKKMRDQAGRPQSSVYVCVLFARAKIIYEVDRRFVDVINLMLPSDEKLVTKLITKSTLKWKLLMWGFSQHFSDFNTGNYHVIILKILEKSYFFQR